MSEDLRNRTKRFASDVIQLYLALPKRRKEVEILGNQRLRSETSVAAHAREASRARSDSEFCSKLDGLLQEADESQLWIELLRDDCGIDNERISQLYGETNELLAIFTTYRGEDKTGKSQKLTHATSPFSLSVFQPFSFST